MSFVRFWKKNTINYFWDLLTLRKQKSVAWYWPTWLKKVAKNLIPSFKPVMSSIEKFCWNKTLPTSRSLQLLVAMILKDIFLNVVERFLREVRFFEFKSLFLTSEQPADNCSYPVKWKSVNAEILFNTETLYLGRLYLQPI